MSVNQRPPAELSKLHPFPLQTNPDGSKNTRYVDVLSIHPVPEGQEFGVYSFISPEYIQKNFELFCQDKFFQTMIEKEVFKMDNMFMGWVSEAFGIDPNELYEGFMKYKQVRVQHDSALATYRDEYKYFMTKNLKELDQEFCKNLEIKTTIRSFKFYGAFKTEKEADDYMKSIPEEVGLQLCVASNGRWNHWDPLGLNQTYADERVNELFRLKQKNELESREVFKNRVEEAKKG